MLKKEYKLNRNDFLKIFKNSDLKENKFFLVLYQKTNSHDIRAGIIVSLKISSLATERNHLKRQIKAILNKKLPLIPKGFKLIIIAKKCALNQEFTELEKALMELLVSLS